MDVFIPTKNSMPSIVDCIKSVKESVPCINNLIIVDAGSVDGTLEYCKTHADIVLVQDKPTIGYARQMGLNAIKTELFVCVDSDIDPLPPRWFEKLSEILLSDPEISIVSGVPVFGSGFLAQYYIYEYFYRGLKVTSLCNAICRTKHLRAVGGFRSLLAAEDADMRFRLRDAGFRDEVDYRIIVHHPRTLLDDFKHVAWWAGGTASLGYPLQTGIRRFLTGVKKALGAFWVNPILVPYLIIRRAYWMLAYFRWCRRLRKRC